MGTTGEGQVDFKVYILGEQQLKDKLTNKYRL